MMLQQVGAITNRPQNILPDASGRLVIAPTTVSGLLRRKGGYGIRPYMTVSRTYHDFEFIVIKLIKLN